MPNVPVTPLPVPTAAPAAGARPVGAGSDAANEFAALVAGLLGGAPAPGAPAVAGKPGQQQGDQQGAQKAPQGEEADAATSAVPVVVPVVLPAVLAGVVPLAPGAAQPTQQGAPEGQPGKAGRAPAGPVAPTSAVATAPAPVPATTTPAPAVAPRAATPALPATPSKDVAQPSDGTSEQTAPPATAPQQPQVAPQATPPAVAVTAPAAPAAPVGSGTPVIPAAVTSQVVPEITRLVSQGDGVHRVTLQLNPRALGEVRVVLTLRQGDVHVRLAAGDQARVALAQGSGDLTRALEQLGLHEHRISVATLGGTAVTTLADTQTGQQTGSHDDPGRPSTSTGTTTTDTSGGQRQRTQQDHHSRTGADQIATDGVDHRDTTSVSPTSSSPRPARAGSVDLRM